MTQIEILIRATIKKGNKKEDEELIRLDLEEYLKKYIDRLAGNDTTNEGIWVYLTNVEHEVTYEEEGKFKFESSLRPICDKCKSRLVLDCEGYSQTVYKGTIVACTGFHPGTVGYIKSD